MERGREGDEEGGRRGRGRGRGREKKGEREGDRGEKGENKGKREGEKEGKMKRIEAVPAVTSFSLTVCVVHFRTQVWFHKEVREAGDHVVSTIPPSVFG